MNHQQPHLEQLIVEAATNFDMPEPVSPSSSNMNQQQHEPAAVTPSNTKPRSISVEMLGEAIQERIDRRNRMAQWIESVKSGTDFK
ncbi:hypothetical protein [Shewanella algae]|uniref:hypothetical protein n=1 Tax=Shewanella algae TaxID=38313 RepID=UPI00300581FA